MIPKKKFHAACVAYYKNPADPSVQTEYFDHIYNLSRLLARRYRSFDVDDTVQDLVEFTIKKKLHERVIDRKGNAFNYYWTCLGHQIFSISKREAKRNVIRTFEMWENSYGDSGEEAERMLKNLHFTLDDFEPDNITILDDMEEVEASKPRRGKVKKPNPNKKPAHWEYVFSQLKSNGTMTEQQLINKLPADKVALLKDPANNVKYYMTTIAVRDGYRLSISKGIYTLEKEGNEKT